jgi:hypothetical protein
MKWLIAGIAGVVALVVLSLVVLAVTGLLFFSTTRVVSEGPTKVEAAAVFTDSIAVTGTATLKVDNLLGDIEIRGGGAAGKVDINATQHAFAPDQATAEQRLSEFRIEPVVGGDRIMLKPQYPPEKVYSTGNTDRVDIVVSVPQDINLDLNSDLGNTSIKNVNGSIQVNTNLGDVTIDSAKGGIQVRDDLGTIRMTGSSLTGNMALTNNLGDIEFSGVFAAPGSHDISAKMGIVKVTLPPDSSFNLDSRVDFGSIKDGFGITKVGQQNNHELRGSAGSDPQVNLKVTVGQGEFDLSKR